MTHCDSVNNRRSSNLTGNDFAVFVALNNSTLKMMDLVYSRYGIFGAALDWFQSYQAERSQAVSINGETSTGTTLKFEVLEGFALGQVIFLLYISSLQVAQMIRKHHFQKFYPDDKQIYFFIEPVKVDPARYSCASMI